MVYDKFLDERENYILYLLETRGRISSAELCAIFNMSPSTIRKELLDMETRGLLIRTHGGAQSIDCDRGEPLSQKVSIRSRQKQAIARAARNLLHDGEMIALSSGSTILALCRLLHDMKRSILVTNSIAAANILMQNQDIELRICGGIVSGRSGGVVGGSADRFFENVYTDQAVLGIDALSISKGITADNILVTQTERIMMRHANKVIVLCDSAKIGNTAIVPLARLDQVDCIITDDAIEDLQAERLRLAGVTNLIVAESGKL